MVFKMNNHEWEIIGLSKKEIKEIYQEEMQEEVLMVYGLTKYDNHKIYINNELCYDMKRKTLMHELMHCYKEEYVSLELDSIDEETLCNISANSHDIIHEIVEDFFNRTNIEMEINIPSDMIDKIINVKGIKK